MTLNISSEHRSGPFRNPKPEEVPSFRVLAFAYYQQQNLTLQYHSLWRKTTSTPSYSFFIDTRLSAKIFSKRVGYRKILNLLNDMNWLLGKALIKRQLLPVLWDLHQKAGGKGKTESIAL